MVIRHRLADGSASDALGVLRAVEPVLVVETRRGDVFVDRDTVLLWKPVPDPPVRTPRVDADRLREIAAAGWPATETEQLGDWLLRACAGVSKRANSVLAVGGPGMGLDRAVARVTDWYTARGLVPRIQESDPMLAEALAAAGWESAEPTLAMVAPVAALSAAEPELREVGYRGVWRELDARERTLRPDQESAAEALLTGADARLVVLGEPAVGIGRLDLVNRWAGLTCLWIDPDRRGQGLGTRLVRGLADLASADGALAVHLQVTEPNPARALYERLGFVEHHRYRYWQRADVARQAK